jgi:hypothetical protein
MVPGTYLNPLNCVLVGNSSVIRWRQVFALGAGLFLGSHVAAADTSTSPTVTIIRQAPIEMLAPDGTVTGVREASAGELDHLVSEHNGELTLRDAQGGLCRIAESATDYVASQTSTPLAPAATASATTNTPPASPPSSASTSPADATVQPKASRTASSSLGPDTTLSSDAVASINAGIGIPLFSTQSLWKESGLIVASRLRLKLEDKTKWETAYRRYFYDDKYNYDPASILGGGAYCFALYADASNVPTSALIAFANDGDYGGIVQLLSDIYRLQHPSSGKVQADADEQVAELQKKVADLEQGFEPKRQAEQQVLTDHLTKLFGDPSKTSFGSDPATREDALRWDWNGVSFLLTCQPNQYNLLRIIPTELADNHGRTERIPRDEMREKLASAVEHRANGDVVITQIPMADQGNKGYCVPATWERVLRYTGVPGDMYTLSRIGGAGFGGGESTLNVAKQLDDTLHDYGRRAELVIIDKIDAISLHRYIDQGIPVFWALNPQGYTPAEERYSLCDRDTDWDDWKVLLGLSRSGPPLPPLQDYGGHEVLITGYNPETREIAWSDPWGRQTKERWMTYEEAQRCSLNEFYIITW